MKSISKAIKADRDHLVRLDSPVKICRLRETVYGHAVPDWHGRVLDITDRIVTIVPPNPGEESCDGASFCPDRIPALDLDLAPSYITHDAGTEEMDAIAEDPAWIDAGWTQPELRRLWDDLLGMMVRRQADALKGWKRLAGNGLARLMRSAVRALGGVLHGHLSALVAAALVAVAGCAVPPDDDVVEAWIWSPTDRIEYTVVPRSQVSDPATESGSSTGSEEASSDVAGAVSSTGEGEGRGEGAQASAGSASSSSAVVLDFRYGGLNGSKAKEDPATQIKGLKVGKDGMSYSWAKGDLGNWGLARTDAGALACIFYREGDKWVGGKFDWISTSRTTRSFENIDSGYNGWNASAFRTAKKHAFCIVSRDGKKRTNLIED